MTAITSTFKCGVCGAVNGKNTRSIPQNKYYWSVIIGILSDHTGFTPDEVHEILKQKFLKKDVIIKEKDKVDIIRISTSTTGLTTIEMEEYLTKIKEWSAIELGIVLPDPNANIQETK